MSKKNIVENHRFIHMLKGLYKSMEREWDLQAKQYDLTNAHQHVLWILYLEDGMKLSELATRGLWNLSTTHDIVNRMVKKGLISKEKDIRDGRITRVYITTLGVQQRNTMKSDLEKSELFCLMKAFHKLEEQDQKKFKEIILFLSKEVLNAEYMKYLEVSSKQLETESE